MSDRKKILIVIAVIFIGCCCIILISTILGFSIFGLFAEKTVIQPTALPLAEQVVQAEIAPQTQTPTATDITGSIASATPVINQSVTPNPTSIFFPQPEQALDLTAGEAVLLTLQGMEVPPNNLLDLAARLQGKKDIPEVLDTFPALRELGEKEQFWVTNVDTNQQLQVDALLQYITAHTYFWIGDNIQFSKEDLRLLAETFENEIYPFTREFFGGEWSPGVDNDPHIYILYVGGLGRSLGGYFSSTDSVNPLAHEYSNAHEMFVYNADNINLYSEYTYTILAHEFQHMIQWNVDRNESTWLNEGFSELAARLNGYTVGGKDVIYSMVPDTPLINWPAHVGDATANYGGAFLFVMYYHDRFGEEMTKDLVAHPANGLESVDAVLAEWGIKEGQTEEELGADDVFQNWVVANYLGDTGLEDGRYGYHSYVSAPRASETEWLSECDGGWQERSVYQYGTDYIRISCAGSYQLEVEGSHEVGVVPENAHSGEMMWWTNRGDESDMTLTRQFDLSEVSGEAELRYWVWYDLEEDYDYVYVEASENGEDWEILRTPGGTEEDPSGNSYGWGYNGLSGGWVEESVDLSSYAGSLVWVRFEYVTDAAVNGEGMLLDDMRLEAIGYAEDFEDGAGGWEGEGFVRIANRLPQAYGMSLIWMRETGVEVERVEMGADQRYEREVELGGDVNELIIVISGMTRYTNQPAGYRFSLAPEI